MKENTSKFLWLAIHVLLLRHITAFLMSTTPTSWSLSAISLSFVLQELATLGLHLWWMLALHSERESCVVIMIETTWLAWCFFFFKWDLDLSNWEGFSTSVLVETCGWDLKVDPYKNQFLKKKWPIHIPIGPILDQISTKITQFFFFKFS